jgi:hypothetical protein
LMGHFGIGELTAVAILAELGDPQRFSSSREVVRYAGMDITVHHSDQRRAPGHLSRQGPPVLRWALFEAAQSAARAGSPGADAPRPAPGALLPPRSRGRPDRPSGRNASPQRGSPYQPSCRRPAAQQGRGPR